MSDRLSNMTGSSVHFLLAYDVTPVVTSILI